jgi:hypothetical protein
MTGWEGEWANLLGHGIGRLCMARVACIQEKWSTGSRDNAGRAREGKGVTEACRENRHSGRAREAWVGGKG